MIYNTWEYLADDEYSWRCPSKYISYDRFIIWCEDISVFNMWMPHHVLFFTWGQFWPSAIVVACMCVCMCVCVRVSVNHEFFRTLTHQPFKLGSSNLDQRCKRSWLRALLFCGMIDCDLQGQIELQSQNLPHFELVHAITHLQLKLQFPNLE